ncbi:hypothetical protein ABZ944_39130, partial [Streptomyces flaveolus]
EQSRRPRKPAKPYRRPKKDPVRILAFAELLVHMSRLLGPDHPDTLITRSHLARWQGEAGDAAGAAAAFAELLADWLRVLGPDPTTATLSPSALTWPGSGGRRGTLPGPPPPSPICWSTWSG